MDEPPDPYLSLDPVLVPWARQHDVGIYTKLRDDPIRSFWLYDEHGERKTQLWVTPLDAEGALSVTVAILDTPLHWGGREVRSARLETLASVLDDLWDIALRWSGPGAFARRYGRP